MIVVRKLSETESSATIVFYFALLAVPLSAIGMLWVGQVHSPEIFAIILAFTIVGTLGQVLLSESLRLANIAVVMPMDYSNLIFATAIGYLVWNQLPEPSLWLGAPFIIGSGIYIALRERKRKAKISAQVITD